MGHDYLSFNGRSVHLQDTQIELLRHFCTQITNEIHPADLKADEQTIDSFRAFFAAWQRAGPGVWINTDFSKFVEENSHRREVLSRLFARVADRVRLFDGTIPLQYLQDHLNSEDCYFVAAHSTTALTDALQDLSEMFNN